MRTCTLPQLHAGHVLCMSMLLFCMGNIMQAPRPAASNRLGRVEPNKQAKMAATTAQPHGAN
jgi:hypothetical protein